MAASAFTYQRVPSEEKGTEFVDVRPASPDVFQWNVKDDAGAIERRFGDWLESACAIALAEWKRTIEA